VWVKKRREKISVGGKKRREKSAWEGEKMEAGCGCAGGLRASEGVG